MSKKLEEILGKEVTIEDFKSMKFRSKLKCYTYDWFCNIFWWPGYLGMAGGAVIGYSLDASSSCGGANKFNATFASILVGLMAVPALRTGYCMARDYIKIKTENK